MKRKQLLFLNQRRNKLAREQERAYARLKKRPVGRPYSYHEGYDIIARKLRLCGLTVHKIADILQVSTHQLQTWCREVPEFKKAWDEGGALADGTVASSLYHRANGYSHPAEKIFYNAKANSVVRAEYTERYPPDTNAAITWLVNRQPKLWRTANRVAGPDGETLQPPGIQIQVVAATQVINGAD
jgi:hypothetical protein